MPPFLEGVLRAHGGAEAVGRVQAFRAEAVRLTSAQLPSFIERRLTVIVEGEKFRRESQAPRGLRRRVEWVDAQRGVQFLSGGSSEAQPILKEMDARRLQAVRSSVALFGLLPMLQRCVAPNSEVTLLGADGAGGERFRLGADGGEWVLSTDGSHLIRSVERGPWLLQFADYRSVGGLRLPFVQRVFRDRQLVYELIFSSVEVNPRLPAGAFTPASTT
jgi:hypothetical protein